MITQQEFKLFQALDKDKETEDRLQEEITTEAIEAIKAILVDTIDKMDTIIKEIKEHTKERTEKNLITSSVKSVIKMDMIGC